MRQAANYEIAYFWSKFSVLLIIPISFLFHFSVVFSERINPLNKVLLFILYGAMILFSIITLTTEILDKPPTSQYWGWTYGPAQFSPILILYYLWQQSLVILTFSMFVLNYFYTKDKIKKKQAKFILNGFLIALIIFLIFDYFRLFPNFPEMGIIGFTISSAFITFAIRKYHLFNLNLYTASDNIIKSLTDSLILTDLKGRIVAVNQATLQLLNYNQDFLLKHEIENIISEDSRDWDIFKKHLPQHGRRYSDIKDIEVNYLTKHNISIPMSLSISIISDPVYNQAKGIIFIGRDISKRKEVEHNYKSLLNRQRKYIDEILKNSKFKTKFISTMSHELRTPLNSIIGFSDLLLDRSYGDLNKPQLEFLKDIKSSSEHLLNLINDLLDISKIEGGNLELNPKEIFLADLMNHITTQIQPLAKEKGLSLRIEDFNLKRYLWVDPVRLKEIFYNLLTNAIKYTKNGGVTIDMKEKHDFWEFSIVDTGIGISQEDFGLVFQEFERTNNPLIKKTEGTGLGLPLTKRLVNLHGGKIWFESKLGEGTTFYFTIPKKNEK
jgi:PAS domain S-box-containing protein